MTNDMNEQDAGTHRLSRLSDLKDYKVTDEDPDIRKFRVFGSNGEPIGKIDELIVDESENKVRYVSIRFEEEIAHDLGKEYILAPVGMVDVDEDEQRVTMEGMALESLRAWPVYAEGEPITREYETRLRSFFEPDGKPIREGDDFYGSQYYDQTRFYRARSSGAGEG